MFMRLYTDYTYTFILFAFFFFNDTATTEIYTLSLHDALPIYQRHSWVVLRGIGGLCLVPPFHRSELQCREKHLILSRSEEHTSELQSRGHLVCRLLLEKKKNSKLHSYTSSTNHINTLSNYYIY